MKDVAHGRTARFSPCRTCDGWVARSIEPRSDNQSITCHIDSDRCIASPDPIPRGEFAIAELQGEHGGEDLRYLTVSPHHHRASSPSLLFLAPSLSELGPVYGCAPCCHSLYKSRRDSYFRRSSIERTASISSTRGGCLLLKNLRIYPFFKNFYILVKL
jgi:hypothetical protein